MNIFKQKRYNKRISLKLGVGNFSDGFPKIICQVGQPGRSNFAQNTGSLPPAPALAQKYQAWRQGYAASLNNRPQIDDSSGTAVRAIVQNIDGKNEPKQFCKDEFIQLSSELISDFNEWLEEKSFAALEQWFRLFFTPNDYIQVVIEVEDAQVRRFPWHLWNFFHPNQYPRAELSISTLKHNRGTQTSLTRRNQLRILAVIGDTTGTEGEQDLNLLVDQFKKTKVEIVSLVQPSIEEFNQQLRRKKGWDIFFFAGHSATYSSGENGYLKLNKGDRLSVSDFRNTLDSAIERGLKLAILNSCDGIGLAKCLDDSNLPQTVVMREQVSDKVAQRFLSYLLNSLQDKPLLLAMRDARRHLEDLKEDCFCATWLPVIFQNPSFNADLIKFPKVRTKISLNHLITAFTISILMSSLVIGLRWQGKLEISELHAYDRLVRQQPIAQTDERITLLLVDEEDRRLFGDTNPQKPTSILPRNIEKLIPIINQYNPAVIGLDIFQRDNALTSDTPIFTQEVKSGKVILICEPSSATGDTDSIAAPPNSVPESIGAASILRYRKHLGDKDSGVVRRQILKIEDKEKVCGNRMVEAFSLKVASQYLEKFKNKKRLDKPEDSFVQFENFVMNPVKIHQGPYHKPNSLGQEVSIQLLLRYLPYRDIQNGPFKVEKIRDVLEGNINGKDFRDKIILIGSNIEPPADSSKDRFFTPLSRKDDYSKSNRVPGVFLHAQMTSNIIDAVESGRSLILTWPSWVDSLWILGWGVVSSLTMLVIVYGKSYIELIFQILATFVILFLVLYLCCWAFLWFGVWIPFIPSLLAIVLSVQAVLFYILVVKIKARFF